MRGMAPVVVLSACNTLRRPDDPNRRALSLGGAFVAAGAQDVFGTLEPIGDRDARGLFFALHEQLARGVAAPEALRRVQLAQIGRPDGAWRRLALLTTIIHRNTD
jgi:CHAT domain-containing protein